MSEQQETHDMDGFDIIKGSIGAAIIIALVVLFVYYMAGSL